MSEATNGNSEAVLIVSLMSGTSVDSIDAALSRIWMDDGGRIRAELVEFYEHAIPAEMRERIFHVFQNAVGSVELVCSLNFEIGAAFADAAEALLVQASVTPSDVVAIASHGQTVWHLPAQAVTGGLVASTLQIGEGSVIYERLGIPVICDFRVADMAAGGQGAPLVPFADYHLFGDDERGRVIQNIGGIANGTVLPAGGGLDRVFAFDSGPGNVMIDALVSRYFPGQTFDEDGRIAARGETFEPLLAHWQGHPYLALEPPKSTGRELFSAEGAVADASRFPEASSADIIATATRFCAWSIADAHRRFIAPRAEIADYFVAGGGARNPTLMAMLAEELAAASEGVGPQVQSLDALSMPTKARECVAFGVLGYARLVGLPGSVPSVTGARHGALLGKIVGDITFRGGHASS